MKLFNRYSRINIMTTVAVLLVASVCYYFIVRFILIHQLENTLKVEEAEILAFVHTNDRLPEASDYRDQHISFGAVDAPFQRGFHDITIFERRHHVSGTYRELSFPVLVRGQWYRAAVTKSEEEVRDLLWSILLITVGVILFLLLMLFVTNRFLLRNLWRPFYRTLESLKEFNVTTKKENFPEPTTITEFDDLNIAVRLMQKRIVNDYETLKNFADNASHEMQTPLAVLNAKLDLLIQESNWNESQTRQLQSMYDALGRLSKLNQSLLLLTKIENNQFHQADPVHFDALVSEKLSQLEELIQAKHLQVENHLQSSTVTMNHFLADILLNNLIGNAIRHNNPGGFMGISLDGNRLLIRNSGPAFAFDEKKIFERFKKGETSEGIGLGLAIVKQICDNYGFDISYFYQKKLHHVQVQFLPQALVG